MNNILFSRTIYRKQSTDVIFQDDVDERNIFNLRRLPIDSFRLLLRGKFLFKVMSRAKLYELHTPRHCTALSLRRPQL